MTVLLILGGTAAEAQYLCISVSSVPLIVLEPVVWNPFVLLQSLFGAATAMKQAVLQKPCKRKTCQRTTGRSLNDGGSLAPETHVGAVALSRTQNNLWFRMCDAPLNSGRAVVLAFVIPRCSVSCVLTFLDPVVSYARHAPSLMPALSQEENNALSTAGNALSCGQRRGKTCGDVSSHTRASRGHTLIS